MRAQPRFGYSPSIAMQNLSMRNDIMLLWGALLPAYWTTQSHSVVCGGPAEPNTATPSPWAYS